MKNKLLLTVTAIIMALVLGILIGRVTKSNGSNHVDDDPPENSIAPEKWTCSMHPNIVQPEPGDCPICGMDLIPLKADAGSDMGPRAMRMTESSMALADIQTTLVERDFPEAEIGLVGRLEYDETRIKSLTARFPARIEQLFVNYTGVPVKKGEHLAIVYSPELLTAQRELLTAYKSNPGSSTTQAAREKLRLWDLLPEQVEEILQRGEASDQFELRAPVGGIVVERNINEGDYMKTGQSLFRIVDLSKLWLYLEAYESDLPWLRFGQEVTFTVEAWPGETFTGKIAFIEPELSRTSRTASVRVDVPNLDGRLKPGMFARGTVQARIAANGDVYAPDLSGKWISPMHPEIVKDGPGQCDVCGMDLVPAESIGYTAAKNGEAPLVVPASAVLRTGKRAVVYLQLPDQEQPTFEGREIVLGPRAGDRFIVVEGLNQGDRVVTNGAFKIDSALQIQAKTSMMSPDEGTTMEEHAGEGSGRGEYVPEISLLDQSSMAEKILPDYFALQRAMASDDLQASREALKSMMKTTGHAGTLPDLIHTMLAAESLETMRRPHFETLSNAFIEVIRENPSSFPKDVYLMHCPMVYPDRGADWLQDDDKLQNPYFGAMMLRCGEVKSNLTDNSSDHNGHAH